MKYTLSTRSRSTNGSIGSHARTRTREHPHLTATEHERLAQQISAIDGVTPERARLQIDQFGAQSMSSPTAHSVPAGENNSPAHESVAAPEIAGPGPAPAYSSK